jgi:hypothetical protein
MFRLIFPLSVASLGLTMAGCGPGEGMNASRDRSTARGDTGRIVGSPETGGQVVERMGGFGTVGDVGHNYRVAVNLSGSLGRGDTEFDVHVAVTRAAANGPLPDAMAVTILLDSNSLPTRTVTVRATGQGEIVFNVVPEKRTDLIFAKVRNVYGVGQGNPVYYFPLGTHKIRVRVGLDGKEPVPLPEMLYLRIGKF